MTTLAGGGTPHTTPTPPPSPIGTLAKDVTTTAHNVTEESAATHNAPHTGTHNALHTGNHNALHAGEGEDVLSDMITMRENLSGNKLHTSWLDRDRIYVCIGRKGLGREPGTVYREREDTSVDVLIL